MTRTAQDFRDEATAAHQRAADSFERSDTDGFLSQWAAGLSGQLATRKAEILDHNRTASFVGLWQGDRRVRARIIRSRFGPRWLIHEDEVDLRNARGKPFVPAFTDNKSRILKELGLTECDETAPAWAVLEGSGTGLGGNVWVATFRTGDKWGLDAVKRGAE